MKQGLSLPATFNEDNQKKRSYSPGVSNGEIIFNKKKERDVGMKLDNSYLSFSMCSKSTLNFCSIFSDGKKEKEGLPPEKKEPIKEYVNLNFEDFFTLMKLKINY